MPVFTHEDSWDSIECDNEEASLAQSMLQAECDLSPCFACFE